VAEARRRSREGRARAGRATLVWLANAISDGASFSLLLAARAAGSSSRRDDSGSGLLLALSGLSYVFTPPIIHAAHGQVGASFASAAVRVGLPVAGLMIGTASADCGNDSEMLCGLESAVIGFSVGVLSAIAIDAAFFAWDSEPETARRARRIRLAPSVRRSSDL
jgi:hypothetical protein